MTDHQSLYRHSLALLTDLYQLTMSYGYWKLGKANQMASFYYSFRQNPFKGGYAIAAGIEPLREYLSNFKFQNDDIGYLATLQGNNQKPLFSNDFLQYLSDMELTVSVNAVDEGTVVFPFEPVIRVTGPILQCQLLETPLLNIINFQSLIATKASRICHAAGGDSILEFGLRRAQGIDGALAASRAAYIGGCAATSNVLAGKLFGIPVKGTHAHSWVMSFDNELEAFRHYADAMPNNCVLLVDTYDTKSGIDHAIEVAKEIEANGYRFIGLRLDSGDLDYLSKLAREKLDAAGFHQASIFASNDLDEHLVENLKHQGAPIHVWGIGTKLVTAYDQPALGGVYKLSAQQTENGNWEPKIKRSEQSIKTSIPGILQINRFTVDGQHVADMIYDETKKPNGSLTIIDPKDQSRKKVLDDSMESYDLLKPLKYTPSDCGNIPLSEIRERVQSELSKLHPTIRRLLNPHQYPAGIEAGLFEQRLAMIEELKVSKAVTV